MISDEEVRHLAKLAHLEVTETEIAEYAAKLGAILGYVQRLEAVDTSGIEPMSHVHGVTNVLREDTTAPAMPFEDLEKNLPDRSGRFIKVPLVVE